MAKIKNIPPGGRPTRHPGRFLITAKRGGKLVITKWPRKRGPIKSEAQRETATQFALAQKRANEAHPWEYIEAENQSRGTIWNRRELLIMASGGTLYDITMEDGSFYGNWFIMASQIQGMLDTISDEPGTMLLRLADGWGALVPGNDGYVLTSKGPLALPVWDAPSGGDAVYQWAVDGGTSINTSGVATKGTSFAPFTNVEVDKVVWAGEKVSGRTYWLTVAELNSSYRITSILHQQNVTALLPSGTAPAVIPLDAVTLFEAGKIYCVVWSMQGAGGGTSMNFRNGNNIMFGFPQIGVRTDLRLSSEKPVVNDLFSTGSVWYAFGIHYAEPV